MAIYRLSAQIVKRSDGRSATAAAAYRAGAVVPDERTGLVFDYTRRRGVLHAEILAPPGTPLALQERSVLWNAVETFERRRDAQVARELELALPHELTSDQRLDLVRSFVQCEFVARPSVPMKMRQITRCSLGFGSAGECLVVMPDQAAAVGAGTEGGRRPTVVPAPTAANPESAVRPRRRTFTAAEKLRILKQVDQAVGTGEVGAILRRHGLYSSALSEWRRQREAGTLGGLAPAKRGPKPAETNPLSAKLTASQKENAQLRRRLERAEAIIELQKKLADLLGLELPPIPPQIGPSSAA